MATYKNLKSTHLAFSLRKEGDFIIPPGGTAELPDDNAHVKALTGKGFLGKQAGKKIEKPNPKTIEK